jgi:hypothetical protein
MNNSPLDRGQNSLLIHIGPRKTGTTAIQYALSTGRDDLRAQGVVYPGAVKQHFMAVNQLIGRRQLWEEDHERSVVEGPWRDLVAEMGDARSGVISTEVLSQARGHHVQRIVERSGGRAPTIVITYRPFEELLSSTWQQLVKEGLREPLDDWSRRAVADQPELSDAPFPRVLDLATLVETWGGVVGTGNVAVVLVDRSRPDAIFEAFEEMLALPNGFLSSKKSSGSKRSLSAQEAELLRQTNVILPRDRKSLKQQRHLLRVVARWLDRHPPSSNDTKLSLAPDVVEQARVRSRAMVTALKSAAGDLRVFGDLETLVPQTPAAPPPGPVPTTVDTELAAHWLARIIGFVPTSES